MFFLSKAVTVGSLSFFEKLFPMDKWNIKIHIPGLCRIEMAVLPTVPTGK